MHRNQAKISVGSIVILLLVLINVIVLQRGMVSDPEWYCLLYATIPSLLISLVVTRK